MLRLDESAFSRRGAAMWGGINSRRRSSAVHGPQGLTYSPETDETLVRAELGQLRFLPIGDRAVFAAMVVGGGFTLTDETAELVRDQWHTALANMEHDERVEYATAARRQGIVFFPKRAAPASPRKATVPAI